MVGGCLIFRRLPKRFPVFVPSFIPSEVCESSRFSTSSSTLGTVSLLNTFYMCAVGTHFGFNFQLFSVEILISMDLGLSLGSMS
jgi:hypothetical protein